MLADSIKGILKYFILTLILILTFLGIYTVLTAKDDFGLANKKKLITKVMTVVGNKPYKLVEEGMCHRFEGWRYLFSEYGAKPERSSVDENLGWLYPADITENPIEYEVVMSEKRVPTKLDITSAKIISQGGFNAYIFKVSRQ